MKIDIITIFPDLYESVFSESLIQKAIQNKLCEINIHNLRDYCEDKHNQVDDAPYGGGPGMVFKPEPLYNILKSLKTSESLVALTCPQGKRFTQETAVSLSEKKHLIIIAAHYEGIDQRITDTMVDMTLSVGDFVLCGGEIPSMLICEATIRLIPGVVGNTESITQDSFQNNLLDHPHYTRPANFRGQNVPTVLLSGSHRLIDEWRTQASIVKTFSKRPDLFACAKLDESEKILFTNYLKSGL